MNLLSLISILLLATLNLHAGEHVESDDIWTAVRKAEALATKYGPERVLFASDLDNTLLKTKQDLGSVPWFNWQDGLLKDQSSQERIACDVPDLLHYFYMAISPSQLSPVQNDQAKAIRQLQDRGIPTIIVTARGQLVASSTFRELLKNNLDFSRRGLAGLGFTAPHLPYDVNNPTSSGLTQRDIERFRLGPARATLYQRGVLFSDGQNKGILLRTLIHKTRGRTRAIVFFDNDNKNTQRVLDAFDGHDVEVVAVRASRMDADIQRFNDSDKRKVTEDFLVLKKLTDRVYSYPRPCQLPIDKLLSAER